MKVYLIQTKACGSSLPLPEWVRNSTVTLVSQGARLRYREVTENLPKASSVTPLYWFLHSPPSVCVFHTYVCTCNSFTHLCGDMWRPEVNFVYPPLLFSTLVFEPRSLTEPEVCCQNSKPQISDCLRLPALGLQVQAGTPPCLDSTWLLRIAQVPSLMEQALFSLRNLSSTSDLNRQRELNRCHTSGVWKAKGT